MDNQEPVYFTNIPYPDIKEPKNRYGTINLDNVQSIKIGTGDNATIINNSGVTYWTSTGVSDTVVPPVWSIITTDDTTFIKVTEPTGNYTYFTLTGWQAFNASGWALSSKTLFTWVFDTKWITYENWNFVDKVTWIIYLTWRVAYKNQKNIFTDDNTFEDSTVFLKPTVHPFAQNTPTGDQITFNADNWEYQTVTFTNGMLYFLNFENLVTDASYLLALNVIYSPSIQITKWDFINCGDIATHYAFTDTLFPATLPTWIHWIGFIAGDTGMHWKYLGQSNPF